MKKNKHLILRISEKDLELVKQTAQKLDMPVSEFVRKVIMREVKKTIKKGGMK